MLPRAITRRVDEPTIPTPAPRAEPFRQASAVGSGEEAQVFVDSLAPLRRWHARRPLARFAPGLRVPTVQLASGRIVAVGAFDAVCWTETVAGCAATLGACVPVDAAGALAKNE